VERLEGLVPAERVLILTGPFLVDQVAAAVPQIPRPQILAEPRAASTAPALAWAAQWISQRDPGAEMLSLHADWAVGDDRAFRSAARTALGVAHEYDVLVTVGVPPTRNDTGYGYIVPGKPLGGARAVRRFVEKPSAARAALLRRRGALWNTGLFAWGVARFLGVGDDVRRSVVWSESEHLAVVGVEDMVVVRANGHTLVIPTGRAERLKALVLEL